MCQQRSPLFKPARLTYRIRLDYTASQTVTNRICSRVKLRCMVPLFAQMDEKGMSDNLGQLLRQLPHDQALFQGVEEATRQGAVLPVLAYLGWNTYNIREVIPEFSVGTGRVDYCLAIGEKKSVFLEVKRMTDDLEKHERQLLEYAFTEGIDIAVLTNGLVWWLYLPLSSGNWQQRKFFAIDIRQQEPEKAVQHFKDFLSREAIVKGTALAHARSAQASREKENLIRQTMPKAWQQLFDEPDERLLDLFADRIESMCGHRPDLETLAHFTKDNSPGMTSQQPPAREKAQTSPPNRPNASRPPKQRGVTIKIAGKAFQAVSVPDMYEQVLKYLCDSGQIKNLVAYLPFATSADRYLLATKPFHPHGNEFRVPVNYDGYYLEAHKSYKTALKQLRDMLKLCGLSLEETT